MLEVLLRLLDKIKELLELRDKRQERIFDRLIEPTYNELQLIHQDYLEMLHQLGSLIPSDSDEWDVCETKTAQALELLRTRRVRFEAVREKLRACRDVIYSRKVSLHEDINSFLRAVLAYLYYGAEEDDPWPVSSVHRTWINTLEHERFYMHSELEKIRLSYNRSVKHVREKWEDVSSVFSALRLNTISH